jgi:nicotinate dehydrogenase subunit A
MTAQDTPPIELIVNGQAHALRLDPKTPVLMVLRQDLELKGTRIGCMEGHCGACTILLGGRPVQTCNLPLEAVAGQTITTIEAAFADEGWRSVRQAFLDEQAAQCGYCTNGIIMTVIGLLGQNPPASRQEVIAALDERHLCRCGAQLRVLRAIDRALAGGSR